MLWFVGGVWWDENCEWEIQICVTLGVVLINNFPVTSLSVEFNISFHVRCHIYIYKVVAFVCVCLCVQLSYSPHHWTDHDQTWHDDGPPPRDGAHHFSRSRS